MKDFLGNDLELQDEVVFTAPSYRSLVRGKIIAFTPTKVRVEYINNWNFGDPGVKQTYLSEPSFLIFVKRNEWPDTKHESHKKVRSSDSSYYDIVCEDCGKTDRGPGSWGELRKPCKNV